MVPLASASSPVVSTVDLCCRFCSLLQSDGSDGSLEWAVVDETEHLVAVPSLGALEPGWVLIIPREHALSFGALGAAQIETFRPQIEELAGRWTKRFGELTRFEHGPASASSAVGCSIDHAHLHLVPLGTIDLLAQAHIAFPHLHFRPVTGLEGAVEEARRQEDYLFLESRDEGAWIASGDRIPSQSLRRVIASAQGRPSEFDWKTHPQLPTVRETLRLADR